MNRYLAFIYLLIILILPSRAANIGKPTILNFTRDHFNGGSEINSIFLDDRGLIYLGNSNGVIEFDGLDWSYVNHTMNHHVLNICIQSDTSALVTFDHTLCRIYFSDNSFINLDTLVSDYNFKNSHAHFWFEHTFYFIKDEVLHSYYNNVFTSIERDVTFAGSADKALLIQKKTGQISLLENNHHTIIGTISEPIVQVISTQKELLILASNTIYKYSKNTKILSSVFKSSKTIGLTCFTKQDTGTLYLGTKNRGLLVLDHQYTLQSTINYKDGLLNGRINQIKADTRGNLWIALSGGLSYIRNSSQFTKLGIRENMGRGNDALSINGKVFLAAQHGLFIGNTDEGLHTFGKITGIEESIEQIRSFGEDLLLSGSKNSFIINSQTLHIHKLPDNYKEYHLTQQYIIGVRNSKLSVFSSIEKLKQNKPLYTSEFYFSKIHFSPDNKIWYVGTNRLAEFEISNKSIEKINTIHLPEGEREILFSKGVPFIFYSDTCLTFTQGKLKPNILLSKSNLLPNIINYLSIDNDSTIWITSEGSLLRFDKEFKQHNNLIFNEIKNQLSVNYNVTQINDSMVLIGSDNGFFCYNKRKLLPKHHFRTLIRKIDNRQKGLEITFTNAIDSRPFHFVFIKTPIKYANNDIAITYSAGANEFDGAKFAHRLIGYDDEWTDWSSENRSEYTNLNSGDYTFAVVGQNNTSHGSRTALVYFTIEKPWYRSWWALSLFVILLLCGIIAIIHTTKQKEKKRNIEQQERNEKEIIRLKNEKLKSEMRLKSLDLANSTMDLVQKNRFLTDLKVDIEALKNSDQQRVKSIVRKIDREIEGEESKKLFEVNFDNVHENFIEQLKKRHSNLTTKDVRLCSFIRMGLSSKEIAPLLNITYRGVELSRYRLRSKLNLQKGENMTMYIQNL